MMWISGRTRALPGREVRVTAGLEGRAQIQPPVFFKEDSRVRRTRRVRPGAEPKSLLPSQPRGGSIW
jgi:hypothetical protein